MIRINFIQFVLITQFYAKKFNNFTILIASFAQSCSINMMFYRKRETRNQARNREISAKLFSHNQFKNVTNIEDNQLSKKLIDENDETFNHAYDTFKSNENEIEVDRINSMNIAKELRK